MARTKGRLTEKGAMEIMDKIALLIYCSGSVEDEDLTKETRRIFLQLCDYYGITEIEENN
jgi:hypothetical protein